MSCYVDVEYANDRASITWVIKKLQSKEKYTHMNGELTLQEKIVSMLSLSKSHMLVGNWM